MQLQYNNNNINNKGFSLETCGIRNLVAGKQRDTLYSNSKNEWKLTSWRSIW